jgi:hypothetical protein
MVRDLRDAASKATVACSIALRWVNARCGVWCVLMTRDHEAWGSVGLAVACARGWALTPNFFT